MVEAGIARETGARLGAMLMGRGFILYVTGSLRRIPNRRMNRECHGQIWFYREFQQTMCTRITCGLLKNHHHRAGNPCQTYRIRVSIVVDGFTVVLMCACGLEL